MAAIETELVIYDDCNTESDVAEFSFNPGECDTLLSITLKKGRDKQIISVDKNDVEMLKMWVESVLVLMK